MTKMLPVFKRGADKICLKWDRFHDNVTSMFDHLRQSEKLVDVTLCSESQKVKVHRLTMAACSPYLRDLLKDNPCEHPVIVLTDTTASDLNAVVEFMYKGSVYLPYIHLESFMKTLDMLQIMEGISTNDYKASPAPVATRLSSSRPAAAEASTSEQRSTHHEPHRSCPRPAKRRRCFVQESSPVSRTALPSQPPTISSSPPEPDSVADSDLDDLVADDYESPAVDPLSCPESEEQLLALEKQIGESADLVKVEEGEIKIEKNVVVVDGTLVYDAESDRGHSNTEVSAGNSADAAGDFLPPVDVKPEPTYQTADEELLNDEKANAPDPFCRPVRRSWIPCDEASHDEDSNDKTSGDGAEEGRMGKDKAQLSDRSKPKRSTRLRQTDTASNETRQTDTWQASEDTAVEDRTKRPPDTGSGTCHCQHCSYFCISQAPLDRHIRHRHGHAPRKGRRKCDWCDYATNISYDFKKHWRAHTGERVYSCKGCGKGFKVSRYLVAHNRAHTGESPYTCEVCGKAFRCSRDLVVHNRIHTGERPYTCDVCGKAFRFSGNLVVHKRTHTGERPYTCDVCGKAFKRSGDLVAHKRTHTGERPYTCDVCGQAFRFSGNLVVHKRTHTGERPYSCNVCGKTFTYKGNLNLHKRTHTCERP